MFLRDLTCAAVPLVRWLCVLQVLLARASCQTGEALPQDMHIRFNLAGTGTPGDRPMVSMGSPTVRVTWELPSAMGIKVQHWFELDIICARGVVVHTSGRVLSSEQNWTFAPAAHLHPATVYSCNITAGGTSPAVAAAQHQHAVSSLPQPFFTSLAEDWGESSPMWSPPCPQGAASAPEFAYFHSTLTVPVAEHDAVVSALAFATAEIPITLPPYGCCGEAEQGSKLLAGYKLFVGGAVIGIGPGRAECSAVAQGACLRQTPYDGFDLTGLVQQQQQQQQQQAWRQEQRGNGSSTASSAGVVVDVLIHSYGQHQPSVNITQRVQFQLVVRLASGKVLTLGSGTGWDAFDATSVYNPRGNSGGAFGRGYWYYAPHEDINASCLVPPPPSGSRSSRAVAAAAAVPGPSSGAACMGCWQQAITKGPFSAPLWPKPNYPIQLTVAKPQSVTKTGPGRFRVLLESELQGGVQLKLAASFGGFKRATVRIRLGEQALGQRHCAFPAPNRRPL